MENIQNLFYASASFVKTLPNKPTNDELLKLYALYKQATCGNCNIPEPGMFSIEGKAKWRAWNSIMGIDNKDAMVQYINFVKELEVKYG
jgi:diazepam-binding inhibitor (GABA receptor modulating acyl-CoA-binding protein)